VTCIRHQRQSLPLYWPMTIGGDSPSAPPVHVRGPFQLTRSSTDRFCLLLRRYPHQSSTRPHTGLHTRSTHSNSKESRLHSHNHLQEFTLKFFIHFQQRAQARFAPQGFWPSCPQALAPYPIPGSYLTPSLVLHYISFQTQHDPVCFLIMCGVQSSGFFIYFIFSRRLATYLCYVVSLHQ